MLQIDALRVERGGRRIIDDFAWQVEAGSIGVCIGPNGAGKTTLLKAVVGIVPARQGAVTLDGVAIASLSGAARARRIAWVPQSSQLRAPLPVETVVAQGRFAHGASSRDAAAITQALSDCDCDALVGRAYTELSGGEQQRVLLARALASEAPLIVLDEPCAHLDIAHALHFLSVLRRLAASGRCLVVAMHDILLARELANTVAILEGEGRYRCGSAEELFTPTSIAAAFDVRVDIEQSWCFRERS